MSFLVPSLSQAFYLHAATILTRLIHKEIHHWRKKSNVRYEDVRASVVEGVDDFLK